LKDVLPNHHSLVLHQVGSGEIFAMALRKDAPGIIITTIGVEYKTNSPNEFQYQ